jgi:hypothetical protein
LVSDPKVAHRKGGFLVRVGAIEEDGKFKFQKFNGKNYQLWNMQMEDYLYQNDLYLSLGGIENKSTTMKDEEWDVLDIKELGKMWLFLATSVDFNISKENTMEDLMKALDRLYEKPSASNKLFIMKHYLI